MAEVGTLRVQIPKKCGFLFRPSRYKVLYGGRGAAKSRSIATVLLVLGLQKKHRVLCVREIQKSLKDSVHKLLKDQIDRLGLQAHYEITDTHIRGTNGTEFIFAGLRSNLSSIKSTEGVTICWVEEAQTASRESWDVLVPTIREAGSEIWVSFNPDQESDPTYQRFITTPPPGAAVVELNWNDNPWFPEELRKQKDYDYSKDPDAAEHVWGGKTRKSTKAQVLAGLWRVEAFEPGENWHGPYYGVDWGFAVDPTVMVRAWVTTREVEPGLTKGTLWIEHEAYGVGVRISDTPALFDRIPGARTHVSRADNARPETIAHLRDNGYPLMEAAPKWPGSVEDGIAHLLSYEAIVIHPRCTNVIQEAKLYSYKLDKLTGDVLPEVVDAHNHCWDAMRYALSPLIKRSATTWTYVA